MARKKDITVCMISYHHNLLDDRIYKKEALTLAKNGYQVIHLGYGNAFCDYYTQDKIRIIQIKRVKKGLSLKSNLALWKQLRLKELYKIAKELKADVYHLHDVELCRIALDLKNLPWKPAIIYDAHEPYFENLKDYWKKRSFFKVILSDIPSIFAEKKISSRIDYLIATEENVEARLKEKNKSTSIIYNYSFFEPLKKYNLIEKKYDIIYSGTLTDSKGLFLMINAIIAAKHSGYELKCVFVGGMNNPRFQTEIKKIIEKEQLENNLIFPGELPIEELDNYYKKSKIAFCIFPSNSTNQLILPIKLFEYAAFGLPIIGSNFGHIKNIIESNHIGICVNPHKDKEVSAAIIDLIENDRYKEYVDYCINCVQDKYLWKYEEAKLLDIYNRIIN